MPGWPWPRTETISARRQVAPVDAVAEIPVELARDARRAGLQPPVGRDRERGEDRRPTKTRRLLASDRPYQARSELDGCVDFATRNPRMQQPVLITSRTISDASVVYKNVQFRFIPSSVYAYTLGANILGRLNPADEAVTQPSLL